MTAEVLGGRVHDNISSQIQRILQVGAGKCIIYTHKNLLILRKCSHGSDIYQLQHRIGWGLYPDKARFFIDFLGNFFRFPHINKVSIDPIALVYANELAIRTAVQVI